MTMSDDMVLGRWCRAATVPAAFTMALTLGVCERAAGQKASETQGESTESSVEVGPDWEIVEDYLERQNVWSEQVRKQVLAGVPNDLPSPGAGGGDSSRPRIVVVPASGDGSLSKAEMEKRLREAIEGRATEPPDIERAAAAAMAILEQGGAHEKTVEAAEFLVNHAASVTGGGKYASRGARALLEFAPDYQAWRFMLPRLQTVARFGPDREAAAAAVFKVLASEAEDPVLRAAGRYYVAAGRMQAANAAGISEEDRAVRRQSALDAAAGLSAGVEEEAFPGDARTFAEAEADLIRSIRHGTVGGKLPDLVGSRLDGVEERFSDYRGRVVLLDFWATWCVPCVAALPKKRQLVADLPADRFALLSISVDAELETVTGFMEDEPMPWANWHVGMTSEITRMLGVGSYPTYILIDEHGEILDRTNHLPDEFVALVEQTVEVASDA